jgi:hypothetical protein
MAAQEHIIEAGLLRGNPKYLNSRLHTIMIESPRFERIAPGTYRLVDAPTAEAQASETTD